MDFFTSTTLNQKRRNIASRRKRERHGPNGTKPCQETRGFLTDTIHRRRMSTQLHFGEFHVLKVLLLAIGITC